MQRCQAAREVEAVWIRASFQRRANGKKPIRQRAHGVVELAVGLADQARAPLSPVVLHEAADISSVANICQQVERTLVRRRLVPRCVLRRAAQVSCDISNTPLECGNSSSMRLKSASVDSGMTRKDKKEAKRK